MKGKLARVRWWAGLLLGLGFGLLLATMAQAGGGGEAHGVTPEKMTDFIWRSVNFLVFAAILVKLVAKPAKEFFARRSQDISQSFAELEAKKEAAEAALKEAEARLAQVASERERLIQEYIAEGEMEKAKIIEKAEMVAARIKEMAALSIAQETKKAAQQLKQEVAEHATRLAEDLLKQQITPADQSKLVEEFLQKVVEKH